mmetsp:Transcript_8775/g.21630  ORF Transcript_8775/g.21630 Transcript_8775/m.21630 type:complete len:285 (+) Transcript_8775:128-982(+)
MSTVKENANPQLFSVENADRYSHSQRAPLNWTKLGSFKQEIKTGGRGISSFPATAIVPTSAEDKAILRAITDSSRSTTNGSGVGLLRKAGLVIPTYSSSVAGLAKAASSSCYSDSSRPVFRLVEDEEKAKEIGDNNTKNNIDESKVSAEEIFDIIRTIQDPEHPNSLEQLGVVSLEQVELSLAGDRKEKTNRNQDEVSIRFTPTIPHCSMATLIGLCLRVKLHRSLPPTKFKVDVSIEPGTHVSEKAINKQLRDKERVRAALENKHLAGVVDKCIRNGIMASSN